MKHLASIALCLFLAVPAWSAAKKITVAELKEMLITMHNDKKSDVEVANALKQVILTEELTRTMMNSLVEDVPGQLSTEQIYVLEARSAVLPPPASDIPTTPALDAGAQQALLNKAGAYASGTWAQLPDLTVTKTTLRFQDNVEALADASGLHSGATDASMGSGIGVNPYNYVHYINATDISAAFEHGAEKLPVDKTQWGRNKMIALQDPDPDLAVVFDQAKEVGTMKWERWEIVNGKAAAVFSFSIPKKKSKMGVHVCCFPDIDQAGIMTMTGQMGSGGTGGSATSGGGAHGNFQTNTNWNPYKEDKAGYHGEFFIDPDTGIIVRMITEAEQKPSDMVHQVDTRIDYGPVTVGTKALVLPVKSVVITEVVPNGEAGAGGFSTRCTLFTSEYKNYELAAK